MGKVKKILAGVLVVAVAGCGISAGLMQLRKSSQKTVNVTPVSGLLQEFYTPTTTLDGTVTSSATQTVNGDKDLIIDQIYVTKGDTVNKGDPLISFDTTLVEMELNIAKLKKQKQEQDLNKAVNRLTSLQNGGPIEESDASTDADDLSTTKRSRDTGTGDDDMTPDDTMSSAADMSGSYLAAAIHPLLLSALRMVEQQTIVQVLLQQILKIQLTKRIRVQITLLIQLKPTILPMLRCIQILLQTILVTAVMILLIREKMIPRSYRRHQLHHWMTIPHILILIIRKVIRILQTVMSHFIRSWMRIRFHLQEVVQRMIHMYICAAVQKKR